MQIIFKTQSSVRDDYTYLSYSLNKAPPTLLFQLLNPRSPPFPVLTAQQSSTSAALLFSAFAFHRVARFPPEFVSSL